MAAQSGRKTEIVLANQPLSRPLSETDILWKTVFAAPVITRPYLVEQPGNKLVALAQDLKFKLYCLDAQNGAIAWSKPLQDRIISDIEGVDFYGNGTKCFSFSSANQIYMLDENGRDVQGFPLKLPAPATNGAKVVDFDQNTKFSFFVACENGKIYGFGHLANLWMGWNGLPSNGVVKQPILHFQHKGKDYLAVLTEAGLLSVYGRMAPSGLRRCNCPLTAANLPLRCRWMKLRPRPVFIAPIQKAKFLPAIYQARSGLSKPAAPAV